MGDAFDENDYTSLRNLKVEIVRAVDDTEEINGRFALCFWLYTDSFASSPSSILVQKLPDVKSNVPFLSLDGDDKLMLFPLLYLLRVAPNPDDSMTLTEEAPRVSTEIELPLKRWVHLGCEVLPNLTRLHLNGEVIGEKPFTPLTNPNFLEDLKKMYLTFPEDSDDAFSGYVHGLDILSHTINIKDHYLKDPPLRLSVDDSNVTDVEEDSSGVWSVVGGKATCRRIFTLDVALLDAFGSPVSRDIEVVASLIYTDTEIPVENTSDDEPPLFVSCNGVEYASHDRPCRLVNGRASFKLKISQLSSKCENRLFRVKFRVPKLGKYPFLEAISLPMRCISHARTPLLTWKESSTYYINGCELKSSAPEEGSVELIPNIVREAKPSSSSKRIKLGHEQLNTQIMDCGGGAENVRAKSESPSNPISDSVIFKYCLGSLEERCHLLKGIAASASEEQIENFGKQVSLFSGCSHHWHQIKIAKRLMEDGMHVWAFITQTTSNVLWENLAPVINNFFMKMAFSTRSLAEKDFECLRRISGGAHEVVRQENFEKMWAWFYPVACAISQGSINAMWNSLQPYTWIQGFITKEEAENTLRGHGNFLPGTFVLRFPSSRSWPHPDAGSLVVTYVDGDCTIRHRLISLDYANSASKGGSLKSLQEMLLEEPELFRPARLVASD